MRRFRILFSAIVIFVLTVSTCYGADITMEDGQIEMTFPKGWEVATGETYSEDVGSLYGMDQEAMEAYLEENDVVLLGQKKFGQVLSTIEIKYGSDSYGQVNYDTCTEDELNDYYNDYGVDIANEFTNDMEQDATYGSASVVKGDWSNYLTIDTISTDEDEKDTWSKLYYTVKEGAVISFLLTNKKQPLTEEEIKDADAIVTEFYDYGYYDNYVGVYEEDYDSDYSGDVDSYEEDYAGENDSPLGSILIPLIIALVAAGIGLLKKAEDQGKTVSQTVNELKGKLDIGTKKSKSTVEKSAIPVEKKETPSKITIPKFQSVKADGKTVQVRSDGNPKRAKTPEEGYIDSLKTLLNSGLLTKQEYQDMIEKHNKRR